MNLHAASSASIHSFICANLIKNLSLRRPKWNKVVKNCIKFLLLTDKKNATDNNVNQTYAHELLIWPQLFYPADKSLPNWSTT